VSAGGVCERDQCDETVCAWQCAQDLERRCFWARWKSSRDFIKDVQSRPGDTQKAAFLQWRRTILLGQERLLERRPIGTATEQQKNARYSYWNSHTKVDSKSWTRRRWNNSRAGAEIATEIPSFKQQPGKEPRLRTRRRRGSPVRVANWGLIDGIQLTITPRRDGAGQPLFKGFGRSTQLDPISAPELSRAGAGS